MNKELIRLYILMLSGEYVLKSICKPPNKETYTLTFKHKEHGFNFYTHCRIGPKKHKT
jgi:hypothetical protein